MGRVRAHLSGKKPLLGSHQRCWIWGRHLVRETLKAGRWPIAELVLSESLDPAERNECQHLAEAAGVPLRLGPASLLEKLAHTREHQGYLARMYEFPYEPLAWLEQYPSRKEAFLVFLDGMQDPFNFGALLRSAEIFGVHAVIIPERNQTGVTSLTARASAGAVNRVPLVRVSALEKAAELVRRKGLRLVAASEKAEETIMAADFTRPLVLVIGNEGQGIRPEMLRLCDGQVRIPQFGKLGSLNAAVAAGIIFYEVRRQRMAAGLSDGTGSDRQTP
mgnify:FL=1